jgi:flagellar protein FlbD
MEEKMVQVTRLDGKEYWINPHQIESMERNPDLTLTMLSGKHVIVTESPETVIERIIEYRKLIGAFKNEE